MMLGVVSGAMQGRLVGAGQKQAKLWQNKYLVTRDEFVKVISLDVAPA